MRLYCEQQLIRVKYVFCVKIRYKYFQLVHTRNFYDNISKVHFVLSRNRVDSCEIESASLLSPLEKIEIGHDNSGIAAGWYLDHVTVTCNSTGCQQVTLLNQF